MLSPPEQICPTSDNGGKGESEKIGRASDTKPDLGTARKVTLGGER